MPEPIPEVGGGTQDGNQDTYLGTYKTREDAEKGVSEATKTIGRLGNEVNELKQRLDKSDKQDAILAQLAASQPEADDKPDPQAGLKAAQERIAKAFGNSEEEGAEAVTELTVGWMNQLQDEQAKAMAELREAQETARRSEIDRIEGRLSDLDPNYAVVKEQVGELAEVLGLDPSNKGDRELLVKLAHRERTADQPERADLPGGRESTRVTAAGEGVGVSPEVEALLATTAIGALSDDEKAALKAREKSRR